MEIDHTHMHFVWPLILLNVIMNIKKGLKFCYATTHCFLGKSWMRIWNIFSCWHKFNVIRLFPFEMDTRSGSKMRIRTYCTHNCRMTCIIDSKTEHLWSQFLAEHHDYGSVSVKTKVCYCWMPLLENLFIKFSIVPLLLLFSRAVVNSIAL